MADLNSRNTAITTRRWICSQIGAREHYSIPRVLHRSGKLECLFTDFWASAPLRLIGRITGKTSLATRFHPELADASVTAFNLSTLLESRQHFANRYEGFLQAGKSFGRSVVKALDSKRSSDEATRIFFGYDTGFLEPARWINDKGGKTVVCQMDPSRFEVDLVKAEEKRWQGWARRMVHVPEAYFRRREEEWEVADLVMVNSEWTRQALFRQGVNADKIVVVPLAFEREHSENGGQKVLGGNSGFKLPVSGFTHAHPLRVLFLGQVILRKGIQYLVEAARLLKDEPIVFDVVGSIGISDEAMAFAPESMTFHGSVNRNRTGQFYRNSDVFVLPTLSDGFALTQIEAMAQGLPVITTPNCGEVVSDQTDGLIVSPGDPMALAEALQMVLQDPGRLSEMSRSALRKAGMFGFERLASNLEAIEGRLG